MQLSSSPLAATGRCPLLPRGLPVPVHPLPPQRRPLLHPHRGAQHLAAAVPGSTGAGARDCTFSKARRQHPAPRPSSILQSRRRTGSSQHQNARPSCARLLRTARWRWGECWSWCWRQQLVLPAMRLPSCSFVGNPATIAASDAWYAAHGQNTTTEMLANLPDWDWNSNDADMCCESWGGASEVRLEVGATIPSLGFTLSTRWTGSRCVLQLGPQQSRRTP